MYSYSSKGIGVILSCSLMNTLLLRTFVLMGDLRALIVKHRLFVFVSCFHFIFNFISFCWWFRFAQTKKMCLIVVLWHYTFKKCCIFWSYDWVFVTHKPELFLTSYVVTWMPYRSRRRHLLAINTAHLHVYFYCCRKKRLLLTGQKRRDSRRPDVVGSWSPI